MWPWAADLKSCCLLAWYINISLEFWKQTRSCRFYHSFLTVLVNNRREKWGFFDSENTETLNWEPFLTSPSAPGVISPEVLWGNQEGDVGERWGCALWWQAVGVTGTGSGTMFGCLLRHSNVWLDWFALFTSPLCSAALPFAPGGCFHPHFSLPRADLVPASS